jgi:hypothetical protein
MNFFRSEESVRRWSEFDPESERQIKPVEVYAKAFSAPFFRRRLDDDFVVNSEKLFQEVAGSLTTGLGWT